MNSVKLKWPKVIFSLKIITNFYKMHNYNEKKENKNLYKLQLSFNVVYILRMFNNVFIG